jgi:hypothetical protein
VPDTGPRESCHQVVAAISLGDDVLEAKFTLHFGEPRARDVELKLRQQELNVVSTL